MAKLKRRTLSAPFFYIIAVSLFLCRTTLEPDPNVPGYYKNNSS